jgi:hypothetical protein
VELNRSRRRLLARIVAGGRLDGAGVPLDDDLREFARSEGMRPLLDWVAGARDVLRAQAAVQLARRGRLSRVLDLLAADGVTAVVFKGAHLAYACYPDPAVRPHVDMDLLIDPRHVDTARMVFERSGHRLLPHVTGRFVMSQCHYVDGSTGGPHAYDVHWQIANPVVFRDVLPFEDVLAQAVPLPAYGPNGRGPSLPHALLISCVHRAAHHSSSERLIWLTDLRLLLRAASPPQVDEFCRLADAAGLNAVCHDAFVRAADLFGDVRVPDRLRQRASRGRELSRAYLSAPSPARQIWLDLRALTLWRDRATLLREHLFPPADYIRATSGGQGALLWQYARRVLRGAVARLRAG